MNVTRAVLPFTRAVLPFTRAVLPFFVREKHVRAGVQIKAPGGIPLLFREEDVKEMFVRGGGSGGQSVARTANCVVLRHVPTGIIVRCHATRSRDLNRKRARLELQHRLDDLARGKDSVRNVKALKRQKSKRKKHARSQAKHGSPFKSGVGVVVEVRGRRGRKPEIGRSWRWKGSALLPVRRIFPIKEPGL